MTDETQNVMVLWDRYGDLLWENGPHKSACLGYIIEIGEIMQRRGLAGFDNTLIDLLTAEFRARGNRNSTVNRKLAALSKLLRKHHRNGGLDRLPDFRKLPEKNGRIRFLTPEEETMLLRSLANEAQENAELAGFLVSTGARVGEALKLAWSDVSSSHATFWDTKAGSPRTIPLSQQAREMVRARLGKSRPGPFSTIRYPNFLNAWNRAKKRAGMASDPDIVPHILRHTCASRLAQAGVDIKRIQEFLGHKTLAMTLRYAHLSPKHLDVCASALDNFRPERLN